MRVATPVAAFPSAAFIEPRYDLFGELVGFVPIVSRVVASSSAEGESSAEERAPGARDAAVTAPGVADFRKAFPMFSHGEGIEE